MIGSETTNSVLLTAQPQAKTKELRFLGPTIYD